MHVDHIPLRRGIRHFLSPLGGVFALLLALMLPLQALAQCVNENIALRGLASATSTLPGYSAARINDGNLSTALGGAYSWSNAPATAVTPAVPVYLKVQLPAEKVVNTVYVYSTLGREIRDYDLQVKSGNSWNTVDQVRDNTSTVRLHRFASVYAYEVRIIGLQGPSMEPKQVRINEIVICVTDPNPTTTVSGVVRQYGTNGSLQNVRIELGGNLSGFTDANGYYRIDNVPAGTYTVRATRAGWTFGSAQYQNSQYAIQVAGAPVSRDLTGYDRNPIVYATGWTDNYARFNPVRGTLSNTGYFPVEAMIQTSSGYTPTLQTNALKVRAGIDTALYTTGQPRAILFGHSMGGLVSRAYVESSLYRNDVSQVFTFGSPHRGIPNLVTLACVINQPAVCQMSKPGMLLFNVTHGQRASVGYHTIGGNAPLWRQQPICFRILRRRFCFGSITLPDFNFRNFGGWLAGLAIPGGDDGLAQTYSSSGMPGSIDRFNTQEVHIAPQLGSRDYYSWGGSLSSQAYAQCVSPVLVQRSRTQCGGVSYQSIFLPFFKQASTARLAGTAAAGSGFEQRSRIDRMQAGPNKRFEREVLVDGSPTLFTAKWSAGSATVTLIDPSGQVFDPGFAAGILDGEPMRGETLSTKLDPDMVLYESSESAATYQLLAPRPGRWLMIVETGADMPDGSDLETNALFNSDFGLTFANDFPFFLVGEKAEIRVTPTGSIFSGNGEATITRLDGVVDTVALERLADGSFVGRYVVPNAPGIAEVSWFVSGTNAAGQLFERGGSDSAQIGRRSLVVTNVGAETAVPSLLDPSRYSALEVPVSLQSDFRGEAMIAADLVDAAGNIVVNAAQSQGVVIGVNKVTLRFAGEDLFANRRNGPYRLTNLVAVDQRDTDLLSDWLFDQLNTAAYDYRQFGPPAPLACGKNNLMYKGSADASSTFSGYSALRTIDGDRSTVPGPEYSWTNAPETDTTPALPANLLLGLATPSLVEQILVYSTADWEIRDYDLEYFDGTRWDTIERVRGNTQTVREHRIPATQIAALRIVGLSGAAQEASQVRVNEVEAYRCTPLVVAMAVPAMSSRFFSLSSRSAVKHRSGIRIPMKR